MIGVLSEIGSSNLTSLTNALDRLGARWKFVSTKTEFDDCSKHIIPGVGHANVTMKRLAESGLDNKISSSRKPTLGICLGMQILFEHCEEGDVSGLGIFEGRVTKLEPTSKTRVPHIGWNSLQFRDQNSALMRGIDVNSYTYFVHSYKAPVTEDTTATSQHPEVFAATVEKKSFAGCQFHPERSGPVGQQILKNFLEWRP